MESNAEFSGELGTGGRAKWRTAIGFVSMIITLGRDRLQKIAVTDKKKTQT